MSSLVPSLLPNLWLVSGTARRLGMGGTAQGPANHTLSRVLVSVPSQYSLHEGPLCHKVPARLLEGLTDSGDLPRLLRVPRCVGQTRLQPKLRPMLAIYLEAEMESLWC